MSFLQDILQVIIAPHKAFKQIITNPKYLGALIILLLFIGVQIGYEYVQFSRTYTEQTFPIIFFNGPALINELPTYTNASSWTGGSNVNLTNSNDYFNYSVYLAGFGASPISSDGYSSIFGNTSLQMEASNEKNVMVALSNTSNVDCSATGFQNISMTLKQVSPETTPPQSATITLYSVADANSYTYDLSSQLSGSSTLGQWNNLTIPVGPNAQGWSTSGNPTWSNITSLVLNFNYPSDSNVTLRVGALFFRGEYLTPVQYGSIGLVIQFLQVFSLQFVFTWFVLTALIYAFCRVLKNAVLWKPIFVAIGLAMSVMVIRALVNLVAAATMQTAYYPFDISLGVRFDMFATLYFPPEAVNSLSVASQNAFPIIDAATSIFRGIVTVMAFISYIWLGALAVYALGALKPEFTLSKRITLAVVGIGITLFVVLLLVGVV